MAKLGITAPAAVTVAMFAAGLAVCSPVTPAPDPPGSAESGPDNGVLGPTALFQRVYRDSVRADRAAQRNVPFEANVDPISVNAIADAADVASDAIVDLASQPDGLRLLAHVRDVQFQAGPQADVSVDDGVIKIAVNPLEGISGYPSSQSIQRAIRARFATPRECSTTAHLDAS